MSKIKSTMWDQQIRICRKKTGEFEDIAIETSQHNRKLG